MTRATIHSVASPRARRPLRSSARRRKGAAQQELPLPNTWGGRRPGAGRKPPPGRSPTPHHARPDHKARHPVHVTLRSAFRPLRSDHVFPTVRIALARANRRDPERFRIVHYSVQHDHVHLIVEASDKRALSAGLRSVSIRVALYVNELLNRKGRLWGDRWFGRELTSPRQVRNALVYVLANFRKHARRAPPRGIDPFSSGASFDGFREWQPGRRAAIPWAGRGPPAFPRVKGTETDTDWMVRPAKAWLTRVGWRRHRLVALDETPSSS